MENEFKEIGKEIPYKVPEGFFEEITELTLEKAHRREKENRKKMIAGRWIAAATIITGMIAGGIWLFNPPDPEVAGNILEISQNEGITKAEPSVHNVKAAPDLQMIPDSVTSVNPVSIAGESMDKLLASISDEELLNWASALHADPFSEETDNNIYYEDN